jgi:hypothetical protein
MLGNRPLLLDRTARKQLAYTLREGPHAFGVVFLAPFSGTLSSQSTGLGVRQTLPFRPREPFFFDQHTLPLVALPRAAEAHDDGAQRRVAAGSTGESGVPTPKKHEVIEIGAREAERPLSLQMKKSALPELLAAFSAD